MDLADLTTLRLGGPARAVIEATTEADLVEAVRVADEAGDPMLLVAGGSNLVVADEGFDGTVIRVLTSGIDVDSDACSGAMVTIAAGESWDGVVARAIGEGWVGIEALSGIPGSVGATPIQNVGAYGQEVSQTIASVRTYDRYDRSVRTIAAADCGFTYRSSRFKAEPQRYVVLSVTFQLTLGDLGAPIAYAELARTLGVELGERAPAADVREAVLALRRGKGMVLDADDHDTWSAGSFFTNPLLTRRRGRRAAARGAALRPARRVGQDERRLADRPRRLRQGLWQRPGGTLDQARPGADQPGLRHDRGAARAGPRDPRWRPRAYGIALVNEPVLIGCEL